MQPARFVPGISLRAWQLFPDKLAHEASLLCGYREGGSTSQQPLSPALALPQSKADSKIFFLTRDALWLKSPWLMPTCLHSNNTKPLNYGLSYGRSSREEEKSVCPSLTIQQNAGS